MDDNLKTLHHAVGALLKARREAKHTAILARASGGLAPHHWEKLHLHDELSRRVDYDQQFLKQAEADMLASWEALNY